MTARLPGWLAIVASAALGVLAASAAIAADAPVGGAAQLRAFLKDSRTARGDFTQRTTGQSNSGQSGSGKSKGVQSSSGQFEFQRPGRFRWVYNAPFEQTIVSDGEKVYLYDKDLNQVTVRRVEASLPASPASILFGTGDFERDFEVTDAGTRDGMAWLTAKPRAKNGSFEQIDIGMRAGVPGAMRLADSFGQTTELAFAHVERNPVVDAAAFRFTPPAGADVLEDR
jgi:outer membrane lipoprotein carrier protein